MKDPTGFKKQGRKKGTRGERPYGDSGWLKKRGRENRKNTTSPPSSYLIDTLRYFKFFFAGYIRGVIGRRGGKVAVVIAAVLHTEDDDEGHLLA